MPRKTRILIAATVIALAAALLLGESGPPEAAPTARADARAPERPAAAPIAHRDVAAAAVIRLPTAEPDPAPPPADVRYALDPDGHGETRDPVEPGECTLALFLVDRATGAPLASKARLWRLDAPGNARWGRGDQCQRALTVPKEGLTLEGLADGRYRLDIAAEGVFAAAAAEFGVTGAFTRVVLEVETPGERDAWLVLCDPWGRRVQEAELRAGGGGRSFRSPETPAWARTRERLADPPDWSGGVGGGASFGGTHSRWRKVAAGPRGFSLGAIRDDPRGHRGHTELDVRVPGYVEVTVKVEGGDPRAHDYVGVLVDPTPILRAIVLPDGRTGADLDDAFVLQVRAIHREDARTGSPWREVPVALWLRHDVRDRYEPFEHSFTLHEGFPGLHPLVPRAVPPAVGGAR